MGCSDMVRAVWRDVVIFKISIIKRLGMDANAGFGSRLLFLLELSLSSVCDFWIVLDEDL